MKIMGAYSYCEIIDFSNNSDLITNKKQIITNIFQLNSILNDKIGLDCCMFSGDVFLIHTTDKEIRNEDHPYYRYNSYDSYGIEFSCFDKDIFEGRSITRDNKDDVFNHTVIIDYNDIRIKNKFKTNNIQENNYVFQTHRNHHKRRINLTDFNYNSLKEAMPSHIFKDFFIDIN